MNSFISSFKPVLWGILIAALIELFILVCINVPQRYNSNLLVLGPSQGEKITSVFLVEKLNRLSAIPARFVQVGDSSGYYGVKPETVMRTAHLSGDDGEWLNYACCARTGYTGYRSLFDEVLRRQDERGFDYLDFMVLNITPYYSPTKDFETGDEAQSLAHYLNPLTPVFYSAGWRLPLTNFIYQGQYENRFLPERTHTYWGKTIDDMAPELDKLESQRGWIAHPADPIEVPTDACIFDLEETSIIERHVYGHDTWRLMAELVATYDFLKERGIGMMLVINPVPCSTEGSADVERFNSIIADFAARYPDVIIPFKAVRTYPSSAFRDKWHLTAAGAEENSTDIGRALKPLINQP